MMDFFDKTLFQQITSGVVILLIGSLLFGKKSATTTTGKGWKIAIIISYLMVLVGLYLMLTRLAMGNIDDPWANRGFLIILAGVAFRYVAKFFIWWHR